MFILGLLINELLITLPIILIVWEFLQSKKSKLLVNIKRITVFGIPMVLYLLFRLTLAAPTKAVSYTYLNSIKQLLFNIRNYLFWSFNWPDEISNQFITFFKFNPVFLANFKKYVILFSMETFIILIFFALIPLFYLIIKKGQVREIGKIGLIGIIWFVITISPVLYYSQHAFPYYLPIPLVGLLITGLVLYQNWEKQIGEKWSCAILISSLIIWYWSSWTNIRLNEFIHWAPRRSLISKTITKNMLQFYPTLPLNTTVFMPYADENKWALGDQNALKFLYSDDIRTFYGNHPEYLKINNGSQFEKFIDYHE